ncbi:DUF6777 domain-containing protein [Pseudonocardia sp. H11422]|uniref:DUF6777 domain-containing protein n=1 Tax=Pseudonocardia sp. H11422 TaxID=2835866 RepID=UPI0039774910
MGIVVIWRDLTRDAPPPAAAGPATAIGDVVLQPVFTRQPDPFAPPAGTDQAGVIPLEGGGGTLLADSPGVYGSTTGTPACDRERLIASLTDAWVAEAWSGVRDIRSDEIPAYIRGLSPAILRSDTFVTDHGYVSSGATVVPAVLQAGTAVLVDHVGLPVVACSSGNPLTPPIRYPAEPSVRGPAWPGFTRDAITVILSSSVAIDRFVMVDIVRGSAVLLVPGTVDHRPAPPGTAVRPVVLHDLAWWAIGRRTSGPPSTRAPTPSTTPAESTTGRANVVNSPGPRAAPTGAPDGISTPRPVAGPPNRSPSSVTRRPRPAPTTPSPNALAPAPPVAATTRPPTPVRPRQPRITVPSPPAIGPPELPTIIVPAPPAITVPSPPRSIVAGPPTITTRPPTTTRPTTTRRPTTTGGPTTARRSAATSGVDAPTTATSSAGPPRITRRQSTGAPGTGLTTTPPADPGPFDRRSPR